MAGLRGFRICCIWVVPWLCFIRWVLQYVIVLKNKWIHLVAVVWGKVGFGVTGPILWTAPSWTITTTIIPKLDHFHAGNSHLGQLPLRQPPPPKKFEIVLAGICPLNWKGGWELPGESCPVGSFPGGNCLGGNCPKGVAWEPYDTPMCFTSWKPNISTSPCSALRV